MTSDAPRQPQDKFILRLPDGMRDRMKAEAEKNRRSMNAEIIARLEESFASQPMSFAGPSPAQRDIMLNLLAITLSHVAPSKIKTLRKELESGLEQIASAVSEPLPTQGPPDAEIAREAREVKAQGKGAPDMPSVPVPSRRTPKKLPKAT